MNLNKKANLKPLQKLTFKNNSIKNPHFLKAKAMPRQPYRCSPSQQKGKRDYRQIEKSSQDRYYNGQSRKKVHQSYDYSERHRDDQKDRRRDPYDDRHKKQEAYEDRPVIRIEPKSVVQVKRSQPVSEIKVHFRFKPLTIKLNSVGEEDLKQKLKKHISQKIGPVAYFERSSNSYPGYVILQLGFMYDGDAFAYLDGKISQIDITVEKEKVWIEAEPTKTFKLLMDEIEQKKKKHSRQEEKERSRSNSKRSKKEKSKHKRKRSYSESSSDQSEKVSTPSRKSYRSRRSDSRRNKKKDDRDKKVYYENNRKDDRRDDRKNEYKIEKKEERREDRKNDYKDDRNDDRRQERKDQRKEYHRREEPRRQDSRRQESRPQLRKEQYRREQSKQTRRQEYGKQRVKQQYKPRIQQRIKEIPPQCYQRQNSINLPTSKISHSNTKPISEIKQQKTLYFFGIHYSVNSKDMDSLFRKHEEGPFIHQELIWRQIKDSISVFLEGTFEKKHALKLLEISDKLEVRGHPFVIVESSSIQVDKLLQKIAQYQINIQFPKKIEPYHLLKGLKQFGRVVQIMSNNKLTDQGRGQYYNVTFNSKQVCDQLKALQKTSKEIIIQEVTKENALYIYRPNSETELMTVNYVEENKEESRERDFYSLRETHRDYHKDYHRQPHRDYHKDRDYYKERDFYKDRNYQKDKGDYQKDYKNRHTDRYHERHYERSRDK